ncbi:MAG: hypothetical protein AB8G86_02220 [Saprospiraceae bacterium]
MTQSSFIEITRLYFLRLTVKNQRIDCYIIEAAGSSEIGQTTVKFFFNPTIGFVKYEYHLMDDSKLTMYLVDFELDCQFEPEKQNFKDSAE